LLALIHTLSTKTIRRGDQFGIYVDVKNGFTDGDICIKYVELTAPMGFIQLEEPITYESEGPDSMSKAPVGSSPSNQSQADKGSLSALPLHFGASTNETVQSTSTQRYEYKLQAGGTYGSDPKPDTHIVSFKVFYKHQGKWYQDASNIEISIFPALTGMLFGTLLGSFIGTMAALFRSNTPFHFDIPTLIARLILNLILTFIAGIILMRKKEV
jgi:hypothetical protein